jgi:large subunit ribosomal protein L4
MKLPVYNKEGKEVKKIELSDDIFGLAWNGDLVHQVVVSMLSNARDNIAHSKNRGEVRGGGKKPWRQKGTGRARHGSSRSPIWVGGGVTFGPRNDQNFKRKINKKVRAKALATVLSQKARENEIILVDEVSFDAPKTKDARVIIEALAKNEDFAGLNREKGNAAMVAMANRDENTEKSFSNFKTMHIDEVRNLNAVDVLNYKYLVILNAEEGVKNLSERLSKTNKDNK